MIADYLVRKHSVWLWMEVNERTVIQYNYYPIEWVTREVVVDSVEVAVKREREYESKYVRWEWVKEDIEYQRGK